MDLSLRNQVVRSQRKLLNLIQIHQECYERISRGEESGDMKEELVKIRADIISCNAEQSELLKQVSMSGSILRCNIYQMADLPDGALPSKNRRRKNIISLTPAQEAAAVATVLKEPSSPPRAPSPVASSASSDSDDEDKSVAARNLINDLIPPCCPGPVPSQRAPLPKCAVSLVQLPKLRRGSAKLSRRQMEQLAAELPVYPPTVPTPPPKDEHEKKLRFMKALQMLPAAEVLELQKALLARRSERKRRSAVNSPYSSIDWEMAPTSTQIFGPITRKQYLAAAKKEKLMAKMDKTDKKGKSAEPAEVMVLAEDTASSSSSSCGVEEAVGCTECGLEIKKSVDSNAKVLCNDCSAARDRTDAINNNLQERGKYKMHLLQMLRSRLLELEQLKKSIIPLLESQALQERLQKDQMSEQRELATKIDSLRNLVVLYQMQPDKSKCSPSPLESPPPPDHACAIPLPVSAADSNQPSSDLVPHVPMEVTVHSPIRQLTVPSSTQAKD